MRRASFAEITIPEKVAAKYVGPEDPLALSVSKSARTSQFGMPLGLIKIADRMQNKCFAAESDYVGPIGFYFKLAVSGLSAQNHHLSLHFLAVPWKKDRTNPLWENDVDWEPMSLGEMTREGLSTLLAKI